MPLVLMVCFFALAGTFRYWEGWLYLIVICVTFGATLAYMVKNAPDLIERRMQVKEKEREQQWIVTVFTALFSVSFLLPGIDHRFGWSDVPVWLVLAATAALLIGQAIVVLAFRENHFAARVIEVEDGFQLIETGPYAIVRHPMYVGTLLMIMATPIALGSYWALPFALTIVPTIVLRIRNEEDVLVRDAPGYTRYKERVRYRLVPRVW
jgi:protein-S-isoprenylcysteine O-methyltransferase Ste14